MTRLSVITDVMNTSEMLLLRSFEKSRCMSFTCHFCFDFFFTTLTFSHLKKPKVYNKLLFHDLKCVHFSPSARKLSSLSFGDF